MTSEEQRTDAAGRKARLWQHMNQVPPIPVREIATREGTTERTVRRLIKQLEEEQGVEYSGWGLRYKASLTDETYRLRARLADRLYKLVEQAGSRTAVATLVGLNTREQLRAINRPFAHDWTLSQIERLGQAVGCGLSELA